MEDVTREREREKESLCRAHQIVERGRTESRCERGASKIFVHLKKKKKSNHVSYILNDTRRISFLSSAARALSSSTFSFPPLAEDSRRSRHIFVKRRAHFPFYERKKKKIIEILSSAYIQDRRSVLVSYLVSDFNLSENKKKKNKKKECAATRHEQISIALFTFL